MNYVVIELDHDNIDLNWTQFKTEQEARFEVFLVSGDED